MNIKRWLADDSASNSVFNVDNRLIIPDGGHKDTAGTTDFDITTLEPDQSLSVKVVSVGTTYPGDDLVVTVFMEP